MIVTNPFAYRQDDKFYCDLLSSLGFEAGNVAVKPFATAFNISINAVSDLYYDLGNLAAGGQVAVTGRSLYYGYYSAHLWCSVFVGGGTVSTYFVLNNISNVIEVRTIAAGDTQVGKDREFIYDCALLQNIRMIQATAANTVIMRGWFAGIQITY